MTGPILLCADGSTLSTAALGAGVELLGRDRPYVVVTVLAEPDPTLVTGTGFAGAVMTPEQYERDIDAAEQAARAVLDETSAALGLDPHEARILLGGAGPAICATAEELGAAAIVIGSRGRGGWKRAVLGSVSDHVVRHAPCPVIVAGQAATG